MTGSGADFKTRQQQELDRFDELWNAATADNSTLPKVSFENSRSKTRSILELAQNIFRVHCAGVVCFDLMREFTLIDDNYSFNDLDSSEDTINSQVRELVLGQVLEVQSELPAEYAEAFDHISFPIKCFARFPLMDGQRVKGFFYLLNPRAKTFGPEAIRNVELLSKTLEDSVNDDSALVTRNEFSRIKNEMARFKAIIEGASGDIFVVNASDYSIILANSQVRKKLGYTDEELQNRMFSDVCGISVDAFHDYVHAIEQGRLQEFACETHIVKKSGETFPAIVELTRDTNGDAPVVVAYVRDMTARLQRQAEFDSLSAYHKAALTVASEVSVGMEAVFDQSGKIVDFFIQQAEPGDFKFSSSANENMVGKRFLDAFPAARSNGFFARCVTAFRSNELDVFEQEYVHDEINEYFRVSAIRVGDDFLQLGMRAITEKKLRNTVWLALHELSNSLDIETSEYMDRMLQIGRKALGMRFAQIANVIADGQAICVTNVDGDHEALCVGNVLPIEETVFLKYGVDCKPVFLSNLDLPCRLVLPEGELQYIHAYAAAPIFVNGKLDSYVSFLENRERDSGFDEFEMGIVSVIAKFISQRKSLDQARHELEASRDELQLIFDNVPAKIIRRDSDNRYLKVNKSAADLFGYSPEALEGMHPTEVIQGYNEKFREIDEAVLKTAKPNLGMVFDCKEDGSLWERVDVVPVMGDGKKADGLLVICTDMTEQKQAEIKLEAVVKELEGANQSLEQFNTVVSHDLKAPLRHMRMLAELLLEAVEPDSEAADYAFHIKENANNCQAMIDALMVLSRVSRAELNRASTDIGMIVDSISDVLKSELNDIGGEIVCHSLPNVQVDAKLVANLFQNLIENAIKYRADRPLRIHIEVDDTGDVPVFAVRDNGRGICADYSKSIFQIFVRLGGEDAPEKGEGVGLSICRRIVERHGGKIWLDTDYKDGACFKFTLAQSRVIAAMH
ncbi:PAS domain S-box protein [Hirschia litorea]|uniref:histidine kinase n=1 Tax=Hirschia litorea TaxID=1199156 RepID=A0ABW2INN1_9PROT